MRAPYPESRARAEIKAAFARHSTNDYINAETGVLDIFKPLGRIAGKPPLVMFYKKCMALFYGRDYDRALKAAREYMRTWEDCLPDVSPDGTKTPWAQILDQHSYGQVDGSYTSLGITYRYTVGLGYGYKLKTFYQAAKLSDPHALLHAGPNMLCPITELADSEFWNYLGNHPQMNKWLDDFLAIQLEALEATKYLDRICDTYHVKHFAQHNGYENDVTIYPNIHLLIALIHPIWGVKHKVPKLRRDLSSVGITTRDLIYLRKLLDQVQVAETVQEEGGDGLMFGNLYKLRAE